MRIASPDCIHVLHVRKLRIAVFHTMQARTGHWMRMSWTLWRGCWIRSAKRTSACARRTRLPWTPFNRLHLCCSSFHAKPSSVLDASS